MLCLNLHVVSCLLGLPAAYSSKAEAAVAQFGIGGGIDLVMSAAQAMLLKNPPLLATLQNTSYINVRLSCIVCYLLVPSKCSFAWYGNHAVSRTRTAAGRQ